LEGYSAGISPDLASLFNSMERVGVEGYGLFRRSEHQAVFDSQKESALAAEGGVSEKQYYPQGLTPPILQTVMYGLMLAAAK
jgi:hypothetical protein